MIVAVAVILNGLEYVWQVKLFGFHWIAWYYIFFSIGVMLRIFMEKPHKTTDRILLWISMVLFPLCVSFFRLHNESPLFYKWINLGGGFVIFYRLLIGCLGTILSYELFKNIKFLSSRILVNCGTVTLGIYYIHNFFLKFVPQGIEQQFIPLSIIIMSIFIFIASYVVTEICKQFKFTRLLILGEYKIRK